MLGGTAGLFNLFEAVSQRHQLGQMQAGSVGQWRVDTQVPYRENWQLRNSKGHGYEHVDLVI